MERKTYHMLVWQQWARLIPLPIVALFVYTSPITSGWSSTMWISLGAAAGIAVLFYLVKGWQQLRVVLDEDGLKAPSRGAQYTWPHGDLLQVREVGSFRARMCYRHAEAVDHAHVWFDLFDRDGFVDALLDWYEHTTGHELPEADEHAAAA